MKKLKGGKRKRTQLDRDVDLRRKLEGQISSAYMQAARTYVPIQPISLELITRVQASKLPQYMRAELLAYRKGISDMLYNLHAQWQLFVDGVPLSSSQISLMREAGDTNVWDRAVGNHVWLGKPDKPFATVEPSPCTSRSKDVLADVQPF